LALQNSEGGLLKIVEKKNPFVFRNRHLSRKQYEILPHGEVTRMYPIDRCQFRWPSVTFKGDRDARTYFPEDLRTHLISFVTERLNSTR